MASPLTSCRRLLFVAALALAGCDDDPTQLIVSIDSDLAVPSQLAVLRASVFVGDERKWQDEFTIAPVGSLPLSFGVAPADGDPLVAITVMVQALAPGGHVTVQRRVTTRLVPGQSVLLPLFLAKSCVNVTCPQGQTCTEDGCEPEEIDVGRDASVSPDAAVDGGEDGQVDAGSMDALVEDATPEDADVDAGLDAGEDADSGIEDADVDSGVDAEVVADSGAEDATPIMDSGTEDATPVADSGTEDAMPIVDSGVEDATPVADSGTGDATPVADSGTGDATPVADSGAEDALVIIDSGVEPDSGVTIDAGTSDSGATDAGTPDSGVCAPLPNTSVMMIQGRCVYACNQNWYDIDGVATNGCEYACSFMSPTDEPDDGYLDTNCDGIDGDVATAIFVAPSPLGSDTNTGTILAPMASIGAALTRAVSTATSASPKRALYVSSGVYVGPLFLQAGISIHGGYDAADDWSRSPNDDPIVQSAEWVGVIAQNLNADVTLDHLRITSGTPNTPGQNSIAILVNRCSDHLTIRRVVTFPGDGAAAPNGAPGSDGTGGDPGPPGGDGCANCGTGGGGAAGGGAGGGNGCAAGGGGGSGGYGGGNGSGGGPGSGSGGAAGTGGQASVGCSACSDCNGTTVAQPGVVGSPGNPGNSGGAGAGGNGFGQISGGGWFGDGGRAGGRGGPGSGGGGGGGGGGGSGICVDSTGGQCTAGSGCVSDRAGGGGGGGASGCGGYGGGGGSPGGGSFGIYVYDSAPLIEWSIVRAGDGGAGGEGGPGGAGGLGGSGGAGGAAGDDGASGARGGDGGDGGRGGGGGGGSGGISYGLFLVQSPLTVLRNLTYVGGDGGMGGSGGAGGTAGQDGTRGLSGTVYRY